GDCISVCDPVRKCVGLDRDGNAGGDFCRSGIPHHWQVFLTTGILGGYTTFSTSSLDVALLYERGQIGVAAVYVLLSVVLSIGGLFAWLALVRNFA
ncbi:MAG: CrcB family protein, partial [Pseudolabrys sp.]